MTCENIDYVEYTFWSAANMGAGTGTQVMGWKTFLGPGLGVPVYTTNWPIAAADFASAEEGINWVSVRAHSVSGAVATLTDAFYFRKDTVPPVITPNAITEASDYLWVSPADGKLYYGTGMAAPQPFTVSGTAADPGVATVTGSGLSKVTFSPIFDNTPANAAAPANWSANYDIENTSVGPANITVTAYDIAGNTSTKVYQVVNNDTLTMTFATMSLATVPSFSTFKIFYPDGVTEMTTGNPNGLFATVPGLGTKSSFIKVYDKNGNPVNVYNDYNDTHNGDLGINKLAYNSATCGTISGANLWCVELLANGCVAPGINPLYMGVHATNILANNFYSTLNEKLTTGGDLGPVTLPPIPNGTPGSFQAGSPPDHLLTNPTGNGLIIADSTLTPWCNSNPGACAPNADCRRANLLAYTFSHTGFR